MNALLLDWSGTLVDDFTPTVYATNEVFKAYGLPTWSADEFREQFYLPYPQFYADILPDVPLAEIELIFQRTFLDCPQPVTILEPTMAFLQWAHRAGIRLFILSSMDAQNFEVQARRFGVLDLFEATYAGVQNKCDLIPEILANHDLVPEKTGFVGDMVHDVHAAQAVGVQSVAVFSGYDSAQVLAAENPTLMLNDIGKLRAVIEACQPVA